MAGVAGSRFDRAGERAATVKLAERAVRLDGDLADWSGADWMTIDARRSIEGAVRIHGEMLYAAWRSYDPNLLSNDAGDGWQIRLRHRRRAGP